MPGTINGETVYTSHDLARLALEAGLPRDHKTLQTAVAIALAESEGRVNAEGDGALQDATWGPSIGLWQIRSLKAESGKGTPRDATKLKDPLFNARSMVAISGGGKNWKPWSVYTTGQHLTRWGYAGVGVGDVLRDPNAGLPGHEDLGEAVGETIPGDKGALGSLNPLAALDDFAELLTSSTFWRRAVEVAAGLLLIAAGLVILNRDLVVKAASLVPGAGQVVAAVS